LQRCHQPGFDPSPYRTARQAFSSTFSTATSSEVFTFLFRFIQKEFESYLAALKSLVVDNAKNCSYCI
jgi:hypothetical protein